MNSNGEFLTNYLHYFQLIAAIPPDLKKKRHLVPRFLICSEQLQSIVK